jgi:hypothetical protein
MGLITSVFLLLIYPAYSIYIHSTFSDRIYKLGHWMPFQGSSLILGRRETNKLRLPNIISRLVLKDLVIGAALYIHYIVVRPFIAMYQCHAENPFRTTAIVMMNICIG